MMMHYITDIEAGLKRSTYAILLRQTNATNATHARLKPRLPLSCHRAHRAALK
jgi:hypothetical protein